MFDIIIIQPVARNNTSRHDDIVQRFPFVKHAASVVDAQQQSLTEFFWIVPDDIIVSNTFDFDYVPDDWSQDYIHVFKNGKDLYDGISLIPKTAILTTADIQIRFCHNTKKVAVLASTPKPYDIFNIDTFAEYTHAMETSTTEMFWMSSVNINIDYDVANNFYIPHTDKDLRNKSHAFLHHVNGQQHYNGLLLCSKHSPLSKREIEYRFPVNRIEHKIVASTPKPYDIVFISYEEPNADENYQVLLKIAPRAVRVHGVKGIHNAHIAAAKLCKSKMFWVVDADATIVDDFTFNLQVHDSNLTCVHVWRSQNPVNDLVYGYGGVKLLPRELTENMDIGKTDMTTSISNQFKLMPVISNITLFNTDPYSTWKSAFRECVKLSSRIIDRQQDTETQQRLYTWCTVGIKKPFGKYAISGAKAGAAYGTRNKDNIAALKKINDFNWLKEKFNDAHL